MAADEKARSFAHRLHWWIPRILRHLRHSRYWRPLWKCLFSLIYQFDLSKDIVVKLKLSGEDDKCLSIKSGTNCQLNDKKLFPVVWQTLRAVKGRCPNVLEYCTMFICIIQQLPPLYLFSIIHQDMLVLTC